MKKIFEILIVVFICFVFSTCYAVNSPTVQNVDALGGQIQNSKIPIYISGDTVNTLTCITATPCVITEIYWYGATTAAHLMAIKDASGNMVYPMRCVVPYQGLHTVTRIPMPGGIYMDDLDSGAVLIIIETGN